MSLHEKNEDETESNITPGDPLIFLPAISEETIFQKTNSINHLSGIFFALSASFIFVSSTFVIKQLGTDFLDVLIVRFLVQTIILSSFILYKRYTLLGGTIWQKILQIICCITGAAGIFLYYIPVRYIDISDISTLSYTRVVWTVVLSAIVYRERPSLAILIALPLTLLGVVFVTQPSYIFSSRSSVVNNTNQNLRLLGFSMILTNALGSAINVLLFKQLISTYKDIKPSVLTFQGSFFALILLIFYQLYKTFYLQTPLSLTYILSWRYLLSAGIGASTILGSVLIQKAIKLEHPAIFSLLSSADIIIALILQNIFTSERSNLYALIGSGLVIGSVVVLVISRIINERNEQKKIKQKKTENGTQNS